MVCGLQAPQEPKPLFTNGGIMHYFFMMNTSNPLVHPLIALVKIYHRGEVVVVKAF